LWSQATNQGFGESDRNAEQRPGEWFGEPTGVGEVLPIEKSLWRGVSLWVELTQAVKDLIGAGEDRITIEYAYRLADVVKETVSLIDTTISHDEDANHSETLYSSLSPFRGNTVLRPFLCEKRAAMGVVGAPADTRPIRLLDIFDTLWHVYQCLWDITENGELRIEHISFYENGGTHVGQEVGLDATTAKEQKTGLPWSHGTNKWKYDTSKLPQTITYSWMDEVSDNFAGESIVAETTTVNLGAKETRDVSRFSTDIDYAIANTEVTSTDGLLLLEVIEFLSVKAVAYETVQATSTRTFRAQNGRLSWPYLHATHHRHELPAASVTMNGESTQALTVRKARTQTIVLPMSEEFDPRKLVRSYLGLGRVEEAKETLSSGETTIQLRHDAQ
jgi:hypothetical protein